MTDLLNKYIFDDRSLRIQTVRLRQAWREVQANHDHPPVIMQLLGELVAASTLLAANLKFDGALVMQLQGSGPIALIVVECRADLSLRATIKVRENQAVPDQGTVQSLMNADGNGRFIVLLDPKQKLPGQQLYQGIVPIEGPTVSAVLERYMRDSEQLETRLWLAADGDTVGGLLLQKLPLAGGNADPDMHQQAESSWERAGHLAATVKKDELLTLEPGELTRRLFWQETLRAFEPEPVRFHCSCSRERVANMLRMLGQPEVESILAEHGGADVKCDFCGKPYQFDPVDCAGLFTSDIQTLPQQYPPTVH